MKNVLVILILNITLSTFALADPSANQSKGRGKATAQKDSQNKIALVISNCIYPSSRQLPNCADGNLLNSSLQKKGFKTEYYSNLNLNNMRRAINPFLQKVKPGDVVFIYYSGYALQFNNKNYLLPTDEKITSIEEIPSATISADNLINELQERKAYLNIVIFDAARYDPLGAKVDLHISHSSRVRRNFDLQQGLAPMNVVGKNMIVALPTSPNKLAFDRVPEFLSNFISGSITANDLLIKRHGYITTSKNPGCLAEGEDFSIFNVGSTCFNNPIKQGSPYARHLVKAINKSDLSLQQVFDDVRREVLIETENQQEPWQSSVTALKFNF